MRIVILNAISARQGGGVTNVLNLLNNLAGRDVNVIVLTNTDNHLFFKSHYFSNIKYLNVKWPSKSLVHRIFWEKFYVNKILSKFRASIYYNVGGTLLAKPPAGCKGVTTLQNMLPFSPKELKRYPITNLLKYKLFLLKYVYIYSFNNSNRICFSSYYSYKAVSKYIKLNNVEHTVIPNGVDDIFYKTYNGTDVVIDTLGKDYYLYVSTFDYYKSQLEVVKEWSLLINNGFNKKLILIGHSHFDYKDRVIKLIKDLKLENFITVMDAVKQEELPTIYANSRALIFASSCECSPNVLLEMMTSKKLIFCSNYEPMPEFGKDSLIYFDPYLQADLFGKILNAENTGEILISEKSQKAWQYSILQKASVNNKLQVEFIISE